MNFLNKIKLILCLSVLALAACSEDNPKNSPPSEFVGIWQEGAEYDAYVSNKSVQPCSGLIVNDDNTVSLNVIRVDADGTLSRYKNVAPRQIVPISEVIGRVHANGEVTFNEEETGQVKASFKGAPETFAKVSGVMKAVLSTTTNRPIGLSFSTQTYIKNDSTVETLSVADEQVFYGRKLLQNQLNALTNLAQECVRN